MTTFDEEIRARIAPLANPLAGAPAGSDLTYEPDYERVAAEIEKLSNLNGGTVDWMLVADDSSRLLSERSKDFRLAGWLTMAKAQREGWRGVAEGLFAMEALVDGFWDTMYPPTKRAKARAGVLAWLWEALEGVLSQRPVSLADTDALKALEVLVSQLDEKLGAKLGDLNPGVGRFRIVVREKVRALPQPPPPPVPKVEAPPPATVPDPVPSTNGTHGVAAAAPAQPPPVAQVAVASAASAAAVAVPTAPAVPTGGSLEELQDAALKWREGLVEIARAARAVAPDSVWPYRILRAATWLVTDEVPISKAPRTYARFAKSDAAASAEAHLASSSWQALLDTTENAFAANEYWLDAHRYSAVALENLNRPAAREIVGREVVAFISRVPKVEALQFDDGTPFASPQTREWLAAERAKWGAGGGPAIGGTGAEIAPAVIEALPGVTEGSDAALAKLLRAAERSDARSRFIGRLEVAKAALDKERNDLALDLAELLLPDVTETLEAWEPTLAADAHSSCLRALQTRNREEAAADGRENQLFRRLLKLDPEAALRLRGS